MKKTIAAILSVCTVLSLCACGDESTADTLHTNGVTDEMNITNSVHTPSTDTSDVFDTVNVDDIISEFLTQAESEGIAPEAKEDGVRLLGDKIEYDGDGITVDKQTATVNKAGTYTFSGTLNDGQIIVDVPKTDKVTLILNGVMIHCEKSAPVYIKSCDDAALTLTEGTVNTLSDGTAYEYDTAEENEPNAALFSKDDLEINGKGTLVVKANYNNGITSKNDLEIKDATVNVSSKHDGIRGKDSVCIKSGTVNVSSGGDGIKSNNADEADRGYIDINGGVLNVSASEDGIQAETVLTVNGGELLIKTGGGSGTSWSGNPYGDASEASAKALKASVGVNVNGGKISIDSADDAVHSNKDVTIAGGNITASSGDDGVHADETLTISGGKMNIKKAYEGLEGVTITISGGETYVKASDDGINGAGGNDNSASEGGRPGAWGGMHESSNAEVTVSGGYLYINADGDGLDSNGSFTMTDGTVIVDGPTNGGNGPLDYTSSFTVSGGMLIAAGSAGMAQNVSSSSTQCAVLVYVSGQGGDTFTISKGGESIISHTPAKKFECVLVSSPKLEKGVEYTAKAGNGTAVTFTQSNIVSTAGSGGGMGGGMRPGGGNRPQMPPSGNQGGRPTI